VSEYFITLVVMAKNHQAIAQRSPPTSLLISVRLPSGVIWRPDGGPSCARSEA